MRSVVLGDVVAATLVGSSATSPTAPVVSCDASKPERAGTGSSAQRFNYGNSRIRVNLNWANGVLRAGRLPSGGYMATINPDGSIYTKVGWWRGVRGIFSIKGRRLDRPALPLRSRSTRRAIR